MNMSDADYGIDTLEQEQYELTELRRIGAQQQEQKRMTGLIAEDKGSFTPAPPGAHLARCYRVIDLGTQEIEYQGKVSYQRKVLIGWELHGDDADGSPLRAADGKPMTISKRYTLSLGDKANLRADLEAWRGKPFDAQEKKGFDITKLLGQFCMLNVVHMESGGKTYANIASIGPVPAVIKKNLPAGEHELQSFNIMAPDQKVFDSFHEKLQDVIRKSSEYIGRAAPKSVSAKQPNAATNTVGSGFDDMDSDIPF